MGALGGFSLGCYEWEKGTQTRSVNVLLQLLGP